MEIIEVAERTPALVGQLVEVWERSVRATHAFLGDADVARIKRCVPEAIAQVAAYLWRSSKQVRPTDRRLRAPASRKSRPRRPWRSWG